MKDKGWFTHPKQVSGHTNYAPKSSKAITKIELLSSPLFPRSCAVTKVQELFYCAGAETVDRTHLTVEFFHQVEDAALVWVHQHAVEHQLFLRRENAQQAFQPGDMVHRQLQGFRQAASFFLKSMDVSWIHRVGATQRTVPMALR